MKKHIPNLITLLNLVSGSMALFMVMHERPEVALFFFLASAVFDFSDGVAARLLKAGSEVGKQLDSLADLVSFGLVPAAMIYMVIRTALLSGPVIAGDTSIVEGSLAAVEQMVLLSVLIVPALAALRLAKFNIQPVSEYFAGLPTPAFALFWAGIYYDFFVDRSIFGPAIGGWFFWGVMIVMSLLMIVPLPMLSLKFSNVRLVPNFFRYLLITIAALILVFTGIAGLPLVVLTYILLSLVRILLT
jgi:CDP-diacylglycerol---serine O-phosphatidyltransferase